MCCADLTPQKNLCAIFDHYVQQKAKETEEHVSKRAKCIYDISAAAETGLYGTQCSIA